MSGNTLTISSTRIAVLTISTPGGTWSTGMRLPAATSGAVAGRGPIYRARQGGGPSGTPPPSHRWALNEPTTCCQRRAIGLRQSGRGARQIFANTAPESPASAGTRLGPILKQFGLPAASSAHVPLVQFRETSLWGGPVTTLSGP